MNGAPARPVMTVLGPRDWRELGLTDAHNHAWIAPVTGSDPASPVLDDFDLVRAELEAYHQAGGGSLLDCQPGGAGRDGRQLAALSAASGVHIIASTGFHRRKYFPAGYALFEQDADQVAAFLLSELNDSLAETDEDADPVRAGFIKVACEASLDATPQDALEGAAQAAARSGALLEVHTEQGLAAEDILEYFLDRGVAPGQIVLCHIDKRPDLALHAELVSTGAALEYDTFYRPKYKPEDNLWPLIEHMAAAGFAGSLAFATDMAGPESYQQRGGPGLASLPGEIRAGLVERGLSETEIRQVLGENIAHRLAGMS